MRTIWTEAKINHLTTLWKAGHSASEISRRLHVASRCAVIGKLHRLGLAAGPRPAIPREKACAKRPEGRKTTRVRPPAVRVSAACVPAPDAAMRCDILGLTRSSCRFPIGDPGAADFAFCGAPRAGAHSYCAHHLRIAYLPASTKKGTRS
jgi:GcrA cell cycle regulator